MIRYYWILLAKHTRAHVQHTRYSHSWDLFVCVCVCVLNIKEAYGRWFIASLNSIVQYTVLSSVRYTICLSNANALRLNIKNEAGRTKITASEKSAVKCD